MATDSKPYDANFWKEARLRSLDPGGFGQDRVEIWAKLLDVDIKDDEDLSETLSEHPDERQIRLDTDRSFVMYPDGDVQGHQEQLNALLVSLFRRHPSLSYFQGFHDIITVLFLTLPPPLRLPCAEKLSLHRTRDAMGEGLEPVLGLLRFLAHLISAVDEDLAKLLKHAAPLPYFALSHLLTMLAHDIPTLPLIQHVFDYLLCRPPISLVYLVAAIIMKRKTTELFALDEDGDGDLGMLHSLFSALPAMSDDLDPLQVDDVSVTPSSPTPSSCSASETVTTDVELSYTDEMETLAESESFSDSETTQTETVVDIPLHDIEDTKSSSPTSLPSPLLGGLSTPPLQTQAEFKRPFSPSDTAPELSSSSDDLNLTPNHAELLPSSPSLDSPLRETRMPSESLPSDSKLSSASTTPTKVKSSAPIALSSLLRSADKLLEAYPPYEGYPVCVDADHSTHTLSDTSSNTPSPSPSSNLSLIPILSSIMGPSSVIYTWSEDPNGLPTTSEAEEIVKNGVNIVHPWDPSFDANDDGEDGADSLEKEEKALKDVKRERRVVRVNPQNLVLGLGAGAGAVLVLAIALALYGSRGNRHGIGERMSLEGVLGVLGAWGAWGWAAFG